jgi:outer membrane biogenesis lipoprotein LolB
MENVRDSRRFKEGSLMKSLTRRLSSSAAAVVLAAGTAMAVAPSASAQEDLPSDSLNNLPESSQYALGGSLGSVMIGSAVLCMFDLTSRPSNACF